MFMEKETRREKMFIHKKRVLLGKRTSRSTPLPHFEILLWANIIGSQRGVVIYRVQERRDGAEE